jgi:hypothetical protein
VLVEVDVCLTCQGKIAANGTRARVCRGWSTERLSMLTSLGTLREAIASGEMKPKWGVSVRSGIQIRIFSSILEMEWQKYWRRGAEPGTNQDRNPLTAFQHVT